MLIPTIQNGANVNALDLWLFTPLHEAASKTRHVAESHLLPFVTFNFCFSVRTEVCTLLLCHGADPTLVNCHTKTAIDLASSDELKQRIDCEFALVYSCSCS